jgi:hypothetical protein
MHARSSGTASPGLRNRLKLEWEVGLQRLPFFTQRLAVGLLGLLVVSLALVGGMVILWGGQQGSDVQLRPPPEAGQVSGPGQSGVVEPPAPVGGVAGHGGGPGVEAGARGGEGQAVAGGDAGATQAPVAARAPSPPTTTGAPGGQGEGRAAGRTGQQVPSTTTGEAGGAPTTDAPTTSTDDRLLGPLPLPPVLTTLLR